jgi:hypothetical protein
MGIGVIPKRIYLRRKFHEIFSFDGEIVTIETNLINDLPAGATLYEQKTLGKNVYKMYLYEVVGL